MKRGIALSMVVSMILGVAGIFATAVAQQNFDLGLWFVGGEEPYPGYVSENEKYLFEEIGANWIIGSPAGADWPVPARCGWLR